MEILSPAGSPEGLIASIKGGCDAVYLGGKSFGARAFSDNFTDQELEGAISYAHNHKVKVYVTVNTLIKDEEMEEAVSFVKYLTDIGADAVLIQDLGLLDNISRFDIQKHASTQMGIQSLNGLEWCSSHGLDRAVLARELTFEELSDIVPHSPIDTEVFVQGAMCYCVSGGCLMSSVCGGRSGNRGQCAQPCRKKYKLGERSGFILSNADLYGVEWLKKLESIGIKAAKIEGRMRSPAYAYLSTKVYSMANEGVPVEEMGNVNDLLLTVFNRGFCEGYLGGIKTLVQNKYADNRGFHLGRVKIMDRKFNTDDLNETVNVKDGISIFRDDDKIGGFKLPNTGIVVAPFKINDGTYDIYRTYDPRIDEIKNLIGPAPKLNGKKKRTAVKLDDLEHVGRAKRKPECSFYIDSLKNLEIVLDSADRVYYSYNSSLKEARKMCDKAGVECVTNLPRLMPSDDFKSEGYPVMIHNPGQYISDDVKVYRSYHNNFFNSRWPDIAYQTTLSVELCKREIEYIAKHFQGRLEIMAFGRTELMYTRDPGLGSGMMTDEKDFQFPVYKDARGFSHVLNSSDLLLLPYLGEFEHMGIESVGIDLRKRPAQLAKIVAEAFGKSDISKKGKITEMCGSINYGAYLKPIN